MVVLNRKGVPSAFQQAAPLMPNTASIVAEASSASRNWLRFNGLGEGETVSTESSGGLPSWVMYGVGGLVLGGVAGYFLLRKKK